MIVVSAKDQMDRELYLCMDAIPYWGTLQSKDLKAFESIDEARKHLNTSPDFNIIRTMSHGTQRPPVMLESIDSTSVEIKEIKPVTLERWSR